MTGPEYAALRRRVGTQQEAADALGVHRVTIADRERGAVEVSREAELAMRHLAECELGDVAGEGGG